VVEALLLLAALAFLFAGFSLHRIDAPGHSGNRWVAGNPLAGIPGTVIDAAWMNAFQEELAGLVESQGLVLSKTSQTQVLEAVTKLAQDAAGARLTFTAGGALVGGEGLLIEDTFGVLEASAGLGDPAALLVLGTHELAKAAVAVTAFERLYWDDGAGLVTTVAGGNRSIGVAAASALLGDATCFVRLSGPPNV
jgi:predicted RecA/RadA family phage recombinase